MSLRVTPLALRLSVCIFLLAAPQALAQSKSLDLTNTVWNGRNGDFSFVLSVTQAKPEQRFLVAVLKGWGDTPLELRGEYSVDDREPHLQLTGSYQGEKARLDVILNEGDVEQKPSLQGEFSVGSNVIPVSAECNRQCPDFSSTKEKPASPADADTAMADLVGEWQDVSGAIGFKEYWSIKFSGTWVITGRFTKGDTAEEVAGSFHGEEIVFDAQKGVLSFQQLLDQKPDENWLSSNEIEVTAQGDTLKFKVRGVEATLTRKPGSRK
ncbi:MAG TPA: hypothetical protein VM095_15250 [Pyrinomonadaceae bacterium]|nr:hypothetical protein [Pyrinomonadaceae bacterium]